MSSLQAYSWRHASSSVVCVVLWVVWGGGRGAGKLLSLSESVQGRRVTFCLQGCVLLQFRNVTLGFGPEPEEERAKHGGNMAVRLCREKAGSQNFQKRVRPLQIASTRKVQAPFKVFKPIIPYAIKEVGSLRRADGEVRGVAKNPVCDKGRGSLRLRPLPPRQRLKGLEGQLREGGSRSFCWAALPDQGQGMAMLRFLLGRQRAMKEKRLRIVGELAVRKCPI